VGQEEGPLTLTEIASSLEYKFESEASTDFSLLLLYIFLPLTPLPVGKLKLNEVPKKPWTHLIVDFITKLLLVARKGAILVVCNRLSKMTYFVTTTEETLIEGLT